jgi:methyl-accepting chemotaxis protein
VALLGDQTLQIANAIEKVIGASVEVANHMDSLLPAVEETSVSTQRMESTSREVHAHVEETARLSGRVVEAAEAGRQRVRRTAAGMEAIRDATGEAQKTIAALAQRGTEIGGILTVIDDVTGETDLLALNAAIIAAQAGERGKAFAVVADQMKALANRVASSTREIQGLVRAVQEGCADAVAAIERGSSRVEDGVTLAREAESSLEDITGAAQESGQRMRDSAAATSDQIESVGHVVQQMEHVRTRTQEIRASARDQEQGHESLRASSDALADLAGGVQETVDAQARDAQRIGRSIETVQQTVREIAGGLHQQLEACRQVARVVEGSGTHIEATEESAAGLSDSARALASEAEALREAVRRFRL